MPLMILVATLALIQFIYFGINVGRARGQFAIEAPQMTGHPVFERHVRVQMNTLEQLVVFLPALFMFSWAAESRGWHGYNIAAALGVVWLVGRTLYARSYVKDPKSRGPGFGLTVFPTIFMLVGSLIAVFMSFL
ncbi:MAG TPA: MAPEG family protein [Candidatus Acidoferrum sp.]|nr:MAPEG family protein [Candidatus Acidoferrum sp.]